MSNYSTGRSDRLRQVVVIGSATFAVVGSFVGSGDAGGTPIQNASGGALAADAILRAPGGPAFIIWTPIYLGLVGRARDQACRSRRSGSGRVRPRTMGADSGARPGPRVGGGRPADRRCPVRAHRCRCDRRGPRCRWCHPARTRPRRTRPPSLTRLPDWPEVSVPSGQSLSVNCTATELHSPRTAQPQNCTAPELHSP
ncbi:hypothetical protein RCH23_000529 [Cryobacterium sp. CAN_C3]|nr:hypothetical protein [Cryobacterium sp. CAN_C3]